MEHKHVPNDKDRKDLMNYINIRDNAASTPADILKAIPVKKYKKKQAYIRSWKQYIVEKDELFYVKETIFIEKTDEAGSKYKKKINKKNIKKYSETELRRERIKLIVPPVTQLSKIWNEYHDHKGGSGANKIRKSIANHFKIQNADEWVLFMKKNCEACQRWQTDTKLAKAPMKLYPITKSPWRRIHVDTMSPFPISEAGNERIVVAACDRISRSNGNS